MECCFYYVLVQKYVHCLNYVIMKSYYFEQNLPTKELIVLLQLQTFKICKSF